MEDNPKVREILDEVSELPVDQRAAFLDRACGEDAALRAEVESLLRALEDTKGFLSDPKSENDAGTGAVDGKIGPYRLLERIGEGGMGAVYLAEQESPVKRQVALKIIKPGMDSAAVIARFETERQALALMDHSNIARVYEAGTTSSGRPYFVMELVRGLPITRHCDENRLTPQQRLELFIPICRAVQHAHQKGIIHRDLKPANVLVSMEDGKQVVKVIDFGIAKAIDQHATEKTAFTHLGMMVGTPEYMSPEQAGGNALETDTRSDVYALGVILYELLTGNTPLDRAQLRQAGYEQMMKTIREAEPPRPSTRLSTLGEGVASISALRGMEPKQLTRLLDGDLDVIVMKCLEKDRSRRYETASGLAREIERYLGGDPIEATPPSQLYIMRKLAWKYRKVISVAAAFALLLAGFLVTTSIVFWILKGQATHQRDVALGALATADKAQHAEAAAKEDAIRQRNEAETQAYTASLFAAEAAVSSDNLAEADTFLNNAPTRLRNWEWYYLHSASNLQILTLAYPYGDDTSHYINNSTQISVLGGDGAIHVLDARTGREVQVIPLPKGVRPLAVSSDLKRIIGGRLDFSLLVLDGMGHELVPIALHQRVYVYATRFTSDHSKFILASTEDRIVRLCDSETGKILHEFTGFRAEVNYTRFNRDETALITDSMDGMVKIWELATGKCIATYQDPSHGWTFSAFSPDSKRVVSSSFAPDRQGVIWDVATGKELLVLREGPHVNVNLNAVFSPDGKMVAFSGGMVTTLLDAQTGHLIATLRGHHARVPGVEFADDGIHILTGCNDNTGRVWSLDSPSRPLVFGSPSNAISDGEFHPDSHSIALHSSDGTTRIYDIATGKIKATIDGPMLRQSLLKEQTSFPLDASRAAHVATAYEGNEFVFDARTGQIVCRLNVAPPGASPIVYAFTHDGTRAITGSALGTLRVWDLSTGRATQTLTNLGSAIRAITIGPDDSRMIVSDADGSHTLWDIVAQKPLGKLGAAGTISSFAFDHDGKRIAAVTYDRFIHIIDATNNTPITTIYNGHADVYGAAFNPDGTRVVLSFQDDIAEVWDIRARKQLLMLKGHDGSVIGASFSPDGTRILTASRDATARLWDAESGHEVLVLRGHSGPLRSAVFSPDGTKILTISDDHTARVWDSVSAEQTESQQTLGTDPPNLHRGF